MLAPVSAFAGQATLYENPQCGCCESQAGYRGGARNSAYSVTCEAGTAARPSTCGSHQGTSEAVANLPSSNFSGTGVARGLQSDHTAPGRPSLDARPPSFLPLRHGGPQQRQSHSEPGVQREGFGLELDYRARCLITPDPELEISIAEQ